MKTTSSSKLAPTGTTDRACKLLVAAMPAIETQELRKIPQVEFCHLLKVSAPTLVNWTSRSTKSLQLEALLQLLERLPAEQWHGLLKRALRVCPAIHSPVLAHEPATVARLRLLIREKPGLTIIRGGSDSARTFVFTALGRAVSQMSHPKVAVSGIDLQVPAWFVPVEALTYISPSTAKASLTSQIETEWLRANQGQWRMFSGVWSAAPDYQKEILAAAQNLHVVVAEAELDPAAHLRKKAGECRFPIRLLDVTAPQADRIHVVFHTF